MAVVLLLGATGFIGRHVSEALRETPGMEVVESRRRVDEHASGSMMLGMDLARAEVGTIVRKLDDLGPTVIVNCAGRTNGPTTQLVEANVLTVARLLDALELSNRTVRFVHVGSAAEYGHGPAAGLVSESAPASPVSPYGATKLAATQLVILARDRGRVEATVMRVFNALGPGMPIDTLPGSLMAKLAVAIAGDVVEVETGPLGAVRDFVDVRDVGRAVAAACMAPQLSEAVINVGTGTGHSARDVVLALARLTGYRGTIKEGSPGSTRSSDVSRLVADITMARRALGWVPERDFAATCRYVAAGVPPER